MSNSHLALHEIHHDGISGLIKREAKVMELLQKMTARIKALEERVYYIERRLS